MKASLSLFALAGLASAWGTGYSPVYPTTTPCETTSIYTPPPYTPVPPPVYSSKPPPPSYTPSPSSVYTPPPYTPEPLPTTPYETTKPTV
ncbi:hypothetical protein P280DRAFT_516821 [Massarina eburnea CBS 473.64]|uniref:Uncharacterized protein n=1 Tax=Massarina eburnea CBS 473.64 TaxID=1395130 RepID=A0A6A6S2P8_9PLEO|nr:hypothetical protein P280DRAFT_516821 [Massarina eburnea CBS 473.64]